MGVCTFGLGVVLLVCLIELFCLFVRFVLFGWGVTVLVVCCVRGGLLVGVVICLCCVGVFF